MANARNYSNTAVSTTLNGAITNVGTNVILASQTGMPSAPFLLAIEPDTASEEIVLVNSGAGTVGSPYVVVRGQDGTTNVAHNSLVVVQHRIAAIDFTDSRTHEDSKANIHKLNGVNVGVAGGTAGLTANVVVSNTASETTAAKSLSLVGNSLVAGSVYKLKAFGTLACTLTPTLTLRLKYGSNILATTTLTFNSGLSSEFCYEGFLNVQTIGGSGSMSGEHLIYVTVASFSAGATAPIHDNAGLLTGISTTGTATFTLTAQWSAASGSNIYTCLGSFIEQIF